jgi:hypothetical protein
VRQWRNLFYDRTRACKGRDMYPRSKVDACWIFTADGSGAPNGGGDDG